MKRPETIVVIGSGPAGSELRGAEIDRHPVVRMCNCEWQPEDRYGTRYDYGLVTSSRAARDASRKPSAAWLFYNVPHERAITSIDEIPFIKLDHLDWYRRAEAHGAKAAHPRRALKFTRGFAAVAGVMGRLHPKRVIVIGMDILRNGETGARYYDPAALPFYIKAFPNMARGIPKWAADEMPPGLRGEGPHDYFTESKMVREIAAETGTDIIWECAT